MASTKFERIMTVTVTLTYSRQQGRLTRLCFPENLTGVRITKYSRFSTSLDVFVFNG